MKQKIESSNDIIGSGLPRCNEISRLALAVSFDPWSGRSRRNRDWMVMLGTIGKAKPCFLADHDDIDGHTYGIWRWN